MCEAQIADMLKTHYDIVCVNIKKDLRGSGRNYWINDRFLLKLFDVNVKYRIEDEITVCQFLRNSGFPTSKHLLGLDGSYIQQIGSSRAHLQERIAGITLERNSLSYSQGKRLLSSLYHVVDLLREYPFLTKINALFANQYNLDDVIHKLEHNYPISFPYLGDLLRSKLVLLERINFDTGGVENPILSHSDFHVQQLIFRDCINDFEQVAVIDFSHVSMIPLEWEIIKACLRSIILDESTNEDVILEAFSAFSKIHPISYNNINIAMIQLLSSTYMERMYITTRDKRWLIDAYNNLNTIEKINESIRRV